MKRKEPKPIRVEPTVSKYSDRQSLAHLEVAMTSSRIRCKGGYLVRKKRIGSI